jgi:hypothetical protein
MIRALIDQGSGPDEFLLLQLIAHVEWVMVELSDRAVIADDTLLWWQSWRARQG